MFGINFVKFKPSDYVIRYKKGELFQEGAGISFFYNSLTTTIESIPIASSDFPFMFEEITNDYQAITIQGGITYRVNDYKKIAKTLDFTYHTKLKKNVQDNSQIIAQRLINIVRVYIKKHIKSMSLQEAIKASELLAGSVICEMRENEEINSLGLDIMGFSILAILPNKETLRALEAHAREEILRKADDALYERRNASIEQERKVKENELNTEIAIETKKKQIKETQLEAQRSIIQKENCIKTEEMAYEIELEKNKKQLIDLQNINLKAEIDTKVYELSSTMKAFAEINPAIIQSLSNIDMRPDKLIAIAFQELASKADKIGQLNISPDLLQSLMQED